MSKNTSHRPFMLSRSSDVFTVFSGSGHNYPMVAADKKCDPNTANLAAMTEWQWITNELPFLMLIPVENPFFGPLFTRLWFGPHNIPIESTSHPSSVITWSLENTVKEEWISLEHNLRALWYAMLKLSTTPLPSFFQFWSSLWRFGYKNHYDSVSATRKVIVGLRNTFLPLMVTLSLMIMLMAWQEKQVPGFNWWQKVLEETGIHCQWLAKLEASAVGDLQTPRTGGFINAQGSQLLWMLPSIRETFPGICLYIIWGPNQGLPFMPIPDSLHHTDIPQCADILCLHSTKALSPAPTHLELPCVEHNSGQFLGESMEDFFGHRCQKSASWKQGEMADDKDHRLHCEIYAAKQIMPNKHSSSARMYFWENVWGFYIRWAVVHHFASIWVKYHPTQCHYNSFCHEWDFARIFDSTHEPGEDCCIDNVVEGMAMEYDQGQGSDGEVPHYSEGLYSSKADLECVHSCHPVSEVPRNIIAEDISIEDLLYLRYGFIIPTSPVPNPAIIPSWDAVCKFLGRGWNSVITPSESLQNAICAFFGYLKFSASLASIPLEIYDLMQEEAEAYIWANFRIWHEELNWQHTMQS